MRRLERTPDYLAQATTLPTRGLSSKWTENRRKPERYGERGTYVLRSLAVIASVRVIGSCARTQRRCDLQDNGGKSAPRDGRQTLYGHAAPDGTLRKDGLQEIEGGKIRYG